MDIKDIRIGNYLFDKDGNVFEVGGITENSIFKKGGNIGIPFDWCNPIRLSENWLVQKMDYEAFPWGYVKEGFPLIAVAFSEKQKFWIEFGNGFKIKLPYVHSIQNLENLIAK